MAKLFHAFYLILPMILSGYVYAQGSGGNNELIGGDVKFHGKVIALACDVQNDKNFLVDFDIISSQELYKNGKSNPIPFTLHLINCNTTTSNSVTVTFSGDESSELPNHLKIVPALSSEASGVAVGLQLSNGTPIALNKATPDTVITAVNMNLGFMAYIEVEPKVLKDGGIKFGQFTSSAQYTLNYQ